jgi:hypothetical protein
VHNAHSHPSTHISAIPGLRKPTSPVKRAIAELMDQAGVRARDCGGIIQAQFPDRSLTRRDVENQWAHHKRHKLNGLTPVGALIRDLNEKGINHVVKYREDDPERLHGVEWSLPIGEKL